MSRPDLWSARFDDYARFHALQMDSGDIDPVYRMLQALAPNLGERRSAAVSFLHVAYYDFGSALLAERRMNGQITAGLPGTIDLPCATERRGHRNRAELTKHLAALQEIDEAYTLHRWIRMFRGHKDLYGAVYSLYGNGRWAAYKTTELLSWSMRPHWPWIATQWAPTDMGHAYSSGPRHGLALVVDRDLPTGNSPTAVRVLDEISDRLVAELHARGLPASPATAETSLCDFHALMEGRYYPGHDIHQLYAQVERATASTRSLGEAALMRQVDVVGQNVFPMEWGKPVDKARKQLYRSTGRLT